MQKTKQNIPESVICEIFNRHSLGSVKNIKTLTGGMFNTVLMVQTDINKYAVKIAPKQQVQVLTYENDLIRSEVNTYTLLSNIKSVHFPKLYGYNFDSDYEYNYLIMEYIDAPTLNKVKLSKEEYDGVMYDLGKAMAQIHEIKSEDGFGYIQNGLKSTWKDAYYDMLQNLIKDAQKKNAQIPYLSEIKALLKENETVFDSVTEPSLVHFDLWQGNIMVKDGRLYALIDCERAMFADVMGEFISLDYAAAFDVNKNKMLIDGYNSISKKKLKFDKEELIRLYFMKLYLGSIAYTETYYRLPNLSLQALGTRQFAKAMIKTALTQLKKLTAEK